ncbi:aldo/keto reductase [Cryobacterium psychrophilum]|uniref:Uncharacterized protein n=1 Tax=Cryobacterium psychrophilum TaxID=41988 RepID=A0A4Y8KJM3_9MICO|nr:aldo/keto reductase [Cryobacterium psychrophilum]TFD74658.1 hypothetical protein E3T53_16990 [Cryobacterium psychrophilum]
MLPRPDLNVVSVSEREPAAVFAAPDERRVIAAGVFNSGLLSRARPLPGATNNNAAAPHDLLRRVDALIDVLEQRAVTLPQAAIAFPLHNSAVASVVLRMRTAAQANENCDLHETAIEPSLCGERRGAGLLGWGRARRFPTVELVLRRFGTSVLRVRVALAALLAAN